jgi:aryl-alcohol dehydrogenase-like predicted oxidoreductase
LRAHKPDDAKQEIDAALQDRTQRPRRALRRVQAGRHRERRRRQEKHLRAIKVAGGDGYTGLDHYVTLGRSGLRVSPLCLGAMTFGEDLGWGSSVEESQQIIDRFIELGGNFIDTANFYTKSHSEKIIGDHVGRHRAARPPRHRDEVQRQPLPGRSERRRLGPQVDRRACENSLRRLQTDYIDLYWLHNWDVHTPIDETMAALDDLVRAGKVRYLGVSDTPAWKVARGQRDARFRGWSAFIGLQIEYSLLERTVEQELVPMARELGLGVTPWSPLKSGALSGKYTRSERGPGEGRSRLFLDPFLNEKTYALVDELEVIAKAHDSTVARVAIAWLQAQPGVTSTIIGARRLAQLEDNLKALDVKLTAEELAASTRSRSRRSASRRTCSRCFRRSTTAARP